MGRVCQKFYLRLAKMISERDLVQSISSKWIRTKVDFGLLNSSLLCLREPRTVCRKAAEPEIDVDFFSHCRQTTSEMIIIKQILIYLIFFS